MRDPLIEEEYQRRIRQGHVSWDELFQRIQKAREILEVTALDSESSWARTKAKEALEALEGK